MELPRLLESLQQEEFDLDVYRAIRSWNEDHLLEFRRGRVRVDWIEAVLPFGGPQTPCQIGRDKPAGQSRATANQTNIKSITTATAAMAIKIGQPLGSQRKQSARNNSPSMASKTARQRPGAR
jgi:hypothetical protein